MLHNLKSNEEDKVFCDVEGANVFISKNC